MNHWNNLFARFGSSDLRFDWNWKRFRNRIQLRKDLCYYNLSYDKTMELCNAYGLDVEEIGTCPVCAIDSDFSQSIQASVFRCRIPGYDEYLLSDEYWIRWVPDLLHISL